MGEKEIEELAKEMAEKQGVTQADAASGIRVAMQVFGDIRYALVAIARTLSSVFAQVGESVEEYVKQLEEAGHSNRQAWPIVWDTRKKNQVLSNKPQFMVRKIIR